MTATAHTLAPLLRSALAKMATTQRAQAARMVTALQVGYGEMETAKELGMTWKALDSLRSDLQSAIVEALHSDGYGSDAEVARYLQLPVSEVLRHTHEPTCMRGLSGEPEAACQCEALRAQRRERAERGHEHEGTARDGW